MEKYVEEVLKREQDRLRRIIDNTAGEIHELMKRIEVASADLRFQEKALSELEAVLAVKE